MQVLVRAWTPLPQVAEHDDHLPHESQDPTPPANQIMRCKSVNWTEAYCIHTNMQMYVAPS